MYYAKWFKTEAEAKAFQKQHRGVLYKNTPRSKTKTSHMITATMMGFDPNVYPYSVNWNGKPEEAV